MCGNTAKLQAATGTWHPKATPSDYCRKGTDVKSWGSSQPLGAEAGPSPALQHSSPQFWQWALLLSASPQTSFLRWVCWWPGEIRKWNKNKNGETTTQKERVQRPRAKVETRSCFIWGWFATKWAGPFSNFEKRQLGAKCPGSPLLPGWPCCFLDLLLQWLTCLCAYLQDQGAYESGELLDRKAWWLMCWTGTTW